MKDLSTQYRRLAELIEEKEKLERITRVTNDVSNALTYVEDFIECMDDISPDRSIYQIKITPSSANNDGVLLLDKGRKVTLESFGEIASFLLHLQGKTGKYTNKISDIQADIDTIQQQIEREKQPYPVYFTVKYTIETKEMYQGGGVIKDKNANAIVYKDSTFTFDTFVEKVYSIFLEQIGGKTKDNQEVTELFKKLKHDRYLHIIGDDTTMIVQFEGVSISCW